MPAAPNTVSVEMRALNDMKTTASMSVLVLSDMVLDVSFNDVCTQALSLLLVLEAFLVGSGVADTSVLL